MVIKVHLSKHFIIIFYLTTRWHSQSLSWFYSQGWIRSWADIACSHWRLCGSTSTDRSANLFFYNSEREWEILHPLPSPLFVRQLGFAIQQTFLMDLPNLNLLEPWPLANPNSSLSLQYFTETQSRDPGTMELTPNMNRQNIVNCPWYSALGTESIKANKQYIILKQYIMKSGLLASSRCW